VKKQSQIVLDSTGFFASRLEPESASTYVPPALRWRIFGSAEASIHSADLTKRSQIGPVFKGFFSSGLSPERIRAEREASEKDAAKAVGSFTWQILK